MYEVRRVLEIVYKTNISEGNVSDSPLLSMLFLSLKSDGPNRYGRKAEKNKINFLETSSDELIMEAGALSPLLTLLGLEYKCNLCTPLLLLLLLSS
jgi:hypothetical protein